MDSIYVRLEISCPFIYLCMANRNVANRKALLFPGHQYNAVQQGMSRQVPILRPGRS